MIAVPETLGDSGACRPVLPSRVSFLLFSCARRSLTRCGCAAWGMYFVLLMAVFVVLFALAVQLFVVGAL